MHRAGARDLAVEKGEPEVLEPRREFLDRLADQDAERVGPVPRPLDRVVHRLGVALQHAVHQLEQQRVLGREIVIDRRLGQPGFLGDGIDRHRSHAFRDQHAPGGLQNLLAGPVAPAFAAGAAFLDLVGVFGAWSAVLSRWHRAFRGLKIRLVLHLSILPQEIKFV